MQSRPRGRASVFSLVPDVRIREVLVAAEAVLAGGFHLPALTQGVAELRRHDFLAMAAGLTTPTLYLNGRADLPFRADERRFLAATRAAGTPARLFHTPGGHLLSLADPDRFTALLRRAHRQLLPAEG